MNPEDIQRRSVEYELQLLSGTALNREQKSQIATWAQQDSWALHHRELWRQLRILAHLSGAAQQRHWRRQVCDWAGRAPKDDQPVEEINEVLRRVSLSGWRMREAGRLLLRRERGDRKRYEDLRRHPEVAVPWGPLWNVRTLGAKTLVYAGHRPPEGLSVKISRVSLGSDDYARGGAGIRLELSEGTHLVAWTEAAWHGTDLDIHWAEVVPEWQRQGLGRWMLTACDKLSPGDVETSGYTDEGQSLWNSWISG